MERELEKRIFMLKDYFNKENMENEIKLYMGKLKIKYPNAIVTKEFYKGENILVRATEISNNQNENKKEREADDWYIRQRGGR